MALDVSSRMSRWAGMTCSVYLVGDIVIDTAFSHAREAVVAALEDNAIRAIVCTHHHEDHTGNVAALAARHDAPAYLRHPEDRWSEGVGELLPYRQLWWGPVPDYTPLPLPEALCLERCLRVVPTPGHSRTHVALYEARTGVVFTGDLLVSFGATAVMAHESPTALVASLRRVADLEPRRLLSGHGLILDAPAEKLRRKADRIEATAAEVRALHHGGIPPDEITRRVFHGGRLKDWWGETMTRGEFSRRCFVKAALAE